MTVFKAILKAEDGEYILSEHRHVKAACDALKAYASEYGEGQSLSIRECYQEWF